MQDVPKYTMSRDAMGRTAVQNHQEEYHGSLLGQRSELQYVLFKSEMLCTC